MHINPWFEEGLYEEFYVFLISSVLIFHVRLSSVSNGICPSFLWVRLVSLSPSPHSSTSGCPVGDFSPSPTQQMVKVEHLTGHQTVSLSWKWSRYRTYHRRFLMNVTCGNITELFTPSSSLYIHCFCHCSLKFSMPDGVTPIYFETRFRMIL